MLEPLCYPDKKNGFCFLIPKTIHNKILDWTIEPSQHKKCPRFYVYKKIPFAGRLSSQPKRGDCFIVT